MSLVLEGVSKVVEGEHHIYPTDLTLERTGLIEQGPICFEISESPGHWHIAQGHLL